MPSPAWMPTPSQELLLDAAFAEDETAAAAWQNWLGRADPNHLDRSSRRLLPLVTARIIKSPGITVPAWILGLRRKAWYQNQILVHRALPLLRALQSRGVGIVVLKGLAFIELYYKDRSLRPMEDIDVMVPPDRVPEAFGILEECNWRASRPVSCPLDVFFRFAYHAWPFRQPPAGQIDLHWRPLRNGCTQDTLSPHTVSFPLDDMSLRTLGHEDHLLQICDHAIRNPGARQSRWVADILTLLRGREQSLDWPWFLEQAGRAELQCAARDLLGYVTTRFHAPVPAYVQAELSVHQPTRREITWYKLAGRGRMADWPLHLIAHSSWRKKCLGTTGRETASLVNSAMRFLRARLRVSRYRRIPFAIISRGAARAFRAIRRRLRPTGPNKARNRALSLHE